MHKPFITEQQKVYQISITYRSGRLTVFLPITSDVGQPPVKRYHVAGVLVKGVPLEEKIVELLLLWGKVRLLDYDRPPKLT